MTPEELSAELDRLSREALQRVMELIRSDVPPREAIEAVTTEFADRAMEGFAEAFSLALGRTVGWEEIRDYLVGDVTLSEKLYAQAEEVSRVARAVIGRHVKGMHSARELALKLYEGYGFRDKEVINLSPRNPKLPKYLRELVRDKPTRDALQAVMARAQAERLKTPALRAGYVELIDAIETGVAEAKLERALEVAYQERMRYHANRIARTELHQVRMNKRAEEYMADPRLQFVEVRMSSKHPRTDICDLLSGQDKYGMGKGIYPKADAPKPPFHPHCYCVLVRRDDLIGTPRERDGAERAFLRKLPKAEAAKVMGSRDKAQRALSGESLEGVWNEGRPKAYKLAKVGAKPQP